MWERMKLNHTGSSVLSTNVIAMLRILLGFAFILSGVSKLVDLHGFAESIRGFEMLPGWLIWGATIAIPVIEVASGVLLVTGLCVRWSSGVVMGLLVIFIAAIVPNIVVGNEIDCGCFGPLTHDKVDGALLVRDIVMLGIAVLVYSSGIHRFSLESLIHEVKKG
jgi:putative oxidoreductase